ncbi:MAG: hypothetical protein BVN33_05925 [Proteobacteria bacterium ST_bin13]|nr:MAG: hypothetical protein BVN33_05925 [Proteobacteria bacterium ST_bin13]
MSDIEEERARAEIAAAAARSQLTGTLVDIQARLHPRALARDAIEELRETGIAIARRTLAAAQHNPGPLIGIGATLVAIFARDWISDAFADHDTKATAASAARLDETDGQIGEPQPQEGKSDE